MSLGRDRCSLYTLFILGALCDCSLFLEIFEYIHFHPTLFPIHIRLKLPHKIKIYGSGSRIGLNLILLYTVLPEKKKNIDFEISWLCSLESVSSMAPLPFPNFHQNFHCIYYVTSSVWPFLLGLSDKFSRVFM